MEKNYKTRYYRLKSDLIQAVREEVLPIMEDGTAEIEGDKCNSAAWEEMVLAYTLYSLGESTPVRIMEDVCGLSVMVFDKSRTTWVHDINLFSCEDLLSLLEWIRFANSLERA